MHAGLQPSLSQRQQEEKEEIDIHNPMDPHDALTQFLTERLSAVGLDAETYGDYIRPLLVIVEVVTEDPIAEGDENDDDEWQSVWDLLQASSETHSDDDAVWNELRRDIQSMWTIACRQYHAQQQQLLKQQQQQLEKEEQAKQAMALHQQQEADDDDDPDHGSRSTKSKDSTIMDAAKLSLLNRFGYEHDDDDDDVNHNGVNNHKKTTEDAMGDDDMMNVSNREIARQQQAAKAQEMRSHKQQPSKRDEQQKTKEARLAKVTLKEDRKKRAVKGERRR